MILKLKLGGDKKNFESIQKYIDVGVEKVILGSACIKNKIFLKESCEKFPNKIALGLDSKDGNLSVSGWKENLSIKSLDFLNQINEFGVSRLIFTDINRDGTKTTQTLRRQLK